MAECLREAQSVFANALLEVLQDLGDIGHSTFIGSKKQFTFHHPGLFEEVLEQSSGFAILCHLFPTTEMKNQLWLSGQCRSRFFKRYSKKTGKQGQSDALRLVFLNHSIQQVQDFTCFTCLKKPTLFIEGVCNTIAAQGFGQDFAFRCFAKENTNMMFFQRGTLFLPSVMPQHLSLQQAFDFLSDGFRKFLLRFFAI